MLLLPPAVFFHGPKDQENIFETARTFPIAHDNFLQKTSVLISLG